LQRMKNDLTTGAWQHDIGCPISIVLLSTSDGSTQLTYFQVVIVFATFVP
jgi:hypothetical protein